MTPADLAAFREHLAEFAKRSPAEKAEVLRELGIIGPDGKLTAAYGGDAPLAMMLFVQGKGFAIDWFEHDGGNLKTSTMVSHDAADELRSMLVGRVYLMATFGETVRLEGVYVAEGRYGWSEDGCRVEIVAKRVVPKREQQASCRGE